MADGNTIGEETVARYAAQGWGTDRIGFGSRPALVIVDMQWDFVDPESPSTCAPVAVDRRGVGRVVGAAVLADPTALDLARRELGDQVVALETI